MSRSEAGASIVGHQRPREPTCNEGNSSKDLVKTSVRSIVGDGGLYKADNYLNWDLTGENKTHVSIGDGDGRRLVVHDVGRRPAWLLITHAAGLRMRMRSH
ncbi:hypothetical protein DNTS_023519 [Danionella cerebrum]|uniref:Uncharacterized protein n=1 Tax=Danionella cerebrum TaxID=2873325 RepID=A0A553QR33_9TELE|nr:hypothetical protein DNTS_023519 [Danionella translucida]